MSKIHGKNCRIYGSKYNLSCDANSVTLDVAIDTAEVTNFCSVFKEYIEGIAGWTLSVDGFFDSDSDQIDEVTQGLIGAGETGFGVYPEGITINNYGYEGEGILSAKPITTPIGGAVTIGLSAQGDGVLSRVVVLDQGTVSATGGRTSKNFGSAGSNTALVAVLRVLSFTGTDATISIQESSDDGSGDAWADLIAFTQVTGTAYERKVSAKAREQYCRINVTGTFTSFTFMVSMEES